MHTELMKVVFALMNCIFRLKKICFQVLTIQAMLTLVILASSVNYCLCQTNTKCSPAQEHLIMQVCILDNASTIRHFMEFCRKMIEKLIEI